MPSTERRPATQAEKMLGQTAKTTATAPRRSGATETVLCKHPNGLVLRLQKPEFVQKPSGVPGQLATEQVQHDVERVTLNGPALDPAKLAAGELPEHVIKNGYALTEGVSSDFLDEWFKQNANSDIVRNRIVLRARSQSEGLAIAKDNRDAKSGLEPLRKDGDPRVPRMRQADEQKSRVPAVDG